MSYAAPLYACLYAREFSAQALLRLRPELRHRPFVVFEGEPPLQHVYSCNAKARLLGIVKGITRVEMDTFPSVTVLSRCRAEENIARTALLECARTFSPSLEDRSAHNVFQCVIDIAGTEKLHGPPSRLAETLSACADAIGIACSISVASNFNAAICLARGMAGKKRVAVTPPAGEATALAALPLGVLNLTEEQAETFSLWGIHTLGMLAALSEKALVARMGHEGKRLRQLACGTLPHLLVPMEMCFVLDEYVEFDVPVNVLESLLFMVSRMLEQLIVRASTRVLALASITACLSLEGGAVHTRTVRPTLPTKDRQRLVKLLYLDLEAHPPNASILSLRLTAESGNTSEVQIGLFSPQLPEAGRLDVTLARVGRMVGEENAGSPDLRDSYRPNHFCIKPFSIVLEAARPGLYSEWKSTMRQLRPAEHVFVTLREERPVLFSFRDQTYMVKHSYGPWLASGEWWNRVWAKTQWDIISQSCEGTILCCGLVLDPAQCGWQVVALYD